MRIIFFYLPFKFLVIDIFELSSLFHFIDGVGLPEARHLNVTFELSRTIKSLDVIESSILGGTEIKSKQIKKINKKITFFN